jgi:2-keto-4-pentenoate hydratase/2-oxohepta-3-ene-1,7-dioic acid hydratase in catechol pathway
VADTCTRAVVAVGRNYAEHVAELAHDVPERPRIYLNRHPT